MIVNENNIPMQLTLEGWRKAKGLTQAMMAGLLNISLPTYVRWEMEPGKIPVSKAKQACDILGVDFNNIIFSPKKDTKSVTA